MFRGTLHSAATWLRITIYCTKTQNKQTLLFMIFDYNKNIQAKLPSSINRISNMLFTQILLIYLW